MNTSHYPSLELCKKLTEIGFPITKETKKDFGIICGMHTAKEIVYECPSVMEMLDVMPAFIISENEKALFDLEIIKQGNNFLVRYIPSLIFRRDKYKPLYSVSLPLPDALAEMILWLHENNYISFSK